MCRPLRTAASASRLLRRSPLKKLGRVAALEVAQSRAEKALAGPRETVYPIEEEDLQEAAGPFVEHGIDPERLAVALIAADCQRGADLQQAVAGWFSVLDAASRRSGWSTLPWMRSEARLRGQQRRRAIVDDAAAFLFHSGVDRPDSLDWLPYAVQRSSPSKGLA